MSVIVGSARIDENGRAYGGQAGDQTGKEVSTQNYYVHSKGWRVLRAKDPYVRKKLVVAMKASCANNRIGYDQYERNSLYKAAEKVGFDISKVTTLCETDCSALVRVCIAYAAGITNLPSSMRTTDMCKLIVATGAFVELKESKYTTGSAYLCAGDILCTKTQGHTVIVLSDGSKAETTIPAVQKWTLGDRELRNGCEGDDVKTLQQYLINLGFGCGAYGADGDFGDCTELAVEAFQRSAGSLEVDGIVGAKTLAALIKAIDQTVEKPRQVKIINGNCYVRSAPNTSGAKLGVAYNGQVFIYQGQTEDGWHLIDYKNENGWVSGKYSELR